MTTKIHLNKFQSWQGIADYTFEMSFEKKTQLDVIYFDFSSINFVTQVFLFDTDSLAGTIRNEKI